MPKVSGTVLGVAIIEGKMLMKAELNGRLPKKGDLITVRFGKVRSNEQNSLYWLYLTFLLNDADLKSEYLTIEELHEMLKATFLSKRVFHGKKEFIHVGSTTTLDKHAFGEYMERIDKAMTEYHHISTAAFWEEVRNREAGPVVQKQVEPECPF